ncbi:hypothetical protein [Bradyrhizobium sp. STM 3562]|uniref:hypothetical protein n=1 Tax=Bradyrhizobium sp. STM 3562 TaxID=578924 RepID=UPI00388FF3A6
MPSKTKTKFMAVTPIHANEVWEIDIKPLRFVERPSVIAVIHDLTGLPLYVTEASVRDGDPAGSLDEIVAKFGSPKTIRIVDTAPSSPALEQWAERRGISITYNPMPIGSWSKQPAEELVWEAVARNDPLRQNH